MKKNIIGLVVSMLLLNQTSFVTVNAHSNENSNETSSVKTVGLIVSHTISIQGSNKTLLISSRTLSNVSMKQIGLKNIVIQYSSNNSDWIDYSTLSDMLVEGKEHTLSDYSVNVSTGYYRVKCDHYAKEKGIWFPDDETISNTSNSVYIS